MYSEHHDSQLSARSSTFHATVHATREWRRRICKALVGAALLLPLAATSYAQLYRLGSASAFAPTSGLVDFETPLLANPSYSDSTSLGLVAVNTGSGFVGESIAAVGGIPTLFSGPTGSPTLTPTTPPGPGSHDVWTYEETVSHDPEVRGPGVLMSDFQSNGAVSILFSTPVAAVGLELANYQFSSLGTNYAGAYQVFAYASNGSLLGSFSNLRTDTNYADVSSYEFVGFATTSGVPLIRALTVASINGTLASDSGPFVDNRIDNLRFGAATDLVATPVPEPSTYAASAVLLLGALTVIRKRARTVSTPECPS